MSQTNSIQAILWGKSGSTLICFIYTINSSQILPLFNNCMDVIYMAWIGAMPKLWRIPWTTHCNLLPHLAVVMDLNYGFLNEVSNLLRWRLIQIILVWIALIYIYVYVCMCVLCVCVFKILNLKVECNNKYQSVPCLSY